MRSRPLPLPVSIALLASAALTACVSGATYIEVARPVATAGSRLAVPGGAIHYRAVGIGPVTPLVVLRDGGEAPGAEPLEALADERLVVRYDPLPPAPTAHRRKGAPSELTREVQQLDSLRRYLSLDRVHLYGRARSATLAVAYYRAHPRNVASLVLADASPEAPAPAGALKSAPLALEHVDVPVLYAPEGQQAVREFLRGVDRRR